MSSSVPYTNLNFEFKKRNMQNEICLFCFILNVVTIVTSHKCDEKIRLRVAGSNQYTTQFKCANMYDEIYEKLNSKRTSISIELILL